MGLYKKLSTFAISTTAALLSVGTIGNIPAEAALFKFTFTSEGANGYIIYDDSVPPFSDRPDIASYIGTVQEYKIDLGDIGVFEGTSGTLNILTPPESIPEAETDGIELEVRAAERNSPYTLLTYFNFPKGSFGRSTALPTSVPSTGEIGVFPYVDFPNTRGDMVFSGTIQTRIEKIPEPVSVSALFGVGAWFILRRRRQTLSMQNYS